LQLQTGAAGELPQPTQLLTNPPSPPRAQSTRDASGSTWELLLKSTFRAGHQAFFIERAGEFLRGRDAQPGDVWQVTREGGELGVRLVKADPAAAKHEDAAEEACSSDVSDQQAIPASALHASPPAAPAPAPPFPIGQQQLPRGFMAVPSPPVTGLSEVTHYGSSSSLASSFVGGAMGPPVPGGGPSSSGDRKRPASAAALDGSGHSMTTKRATPGSSPAAVSTAGMPPMPVPQYGFALPPAAVPVGGGTAAAPGWQQGAAAPAQPYYYAAAAAPAPAAPAPQPPQQQLVVTCNGLQGMLDVADMMIVVGPGAPQHQGSRVLPEVFEALAGKFSTRKWRRTLVVHPGAADPTVLAPTPIGEWLARYPQLEARLPPRGTGRAAARAALDAMGEGAIGGGGARDEALRAVTAVAAPAAAPLAPASSAALGHPSERAARPGADGARGGGHHQHGGTAAQPHHARRDPIKPRHITIRNAHGRGEGQADAGGLAAGSAPATGAGGAALASAGLAGAPIRWLPVQCIDLGGWLDLTEFIVVVINPRVSTCVNCSALSAAVPPHSWPPPRPLLTLTLLLSPHPHPAAQGDACRLSPAEFEALAGKASTRKWRRSLVVHPGGDDARVKEPITIGEWMRRHSVQGAVGPIPGSRPAPPAASGGAAAAAAVAAAAASAPAAAAVLAAPAAPAPSAHAPAAAAVPPQHPPVLTHPSQRSKVTPSGLTHPSQRSRYHHQQRPQAHSFPPQHQPYAPAPAAQLPLWRHHAPQSFSPPPRVATPMLPGATLSPPHRGIAALLSSGLGGAGGAARGDEAEWMDQDHDLLCGGCGGMMGMAGLGDLCVDDGLVMGALPPCGRAAAAPPPPPAAASAPVAVVSSAEQEEDDGADALILSSSSGGCADWMPVGW
jgi:hypothetical protein